MAGDVNFRLEGAKEFERLLRQLGDRAAKRIADQGLRAAAKPIVARAKDLVPVRTGELRDSIASLRGRSGADSRRREIGFRPPVSRRAHFTEFGTVHSAAQPFMRPALDGEKERALDEMARVMQRGIEREASRMAGQMQRRRR